MPRSKNLTASNLAVSTQFVERRIYLIRGHKVMIDEDLAELYGVSTKHLNQQVRRNQKRFPDDFMFQLTKEETEILRSQIVTSRSAFLFVNSHLSVLEVANCDFKKKAGDS